MKKVSVSYLKPKKGFGYFGMDVSITTTLTKQLTFTHHLYAPRSKRCSFNTIQFSQ